MISPQVIGRYISPYKYWVEVASGLWASWEGSLWILVHKAGTKELGAWKRARYMTKKLSVSPAIRRRVRKYGWMLNSPLSWKPRRLFGTFVEMPDRKAHG